MDMTTVVQDPCGLTIEKTERVEILPDGTRKKIVETRYRGPRRIIERLQLKKYGAAATEDIANHAQIGVDVFFERVTPDSQMPSDEPNGYLIERAWAEGWTQDEVNQIIRSTTPSKTFVEILLSRLGLSPSSKAATGKGEKKLGIRARLNRTMADMDVTTTAGAGASSGKSSLAEKMRLHRDQTQSDEQLCTLFLENVPDDYTEADIKAELTGFSLQRVNVVKNEDSDGVRRSAGKAFVVLQSVDDVEPCLEFLNSSRWGYQVVSATISKPRV